MGLWALHVGHSNSVNRRFLPGPALLSSSSSSTSKCLSRPPPGTMAGDYSGFARADRGFPRPAEARPLAGPQPEAHLPAMLTCVAAALVASGSVQISPTNSGEKVGLGS